MRLTIFMHELARRASSNLVRAEVAFLHMFLSIYLAIYLSINSSTPSLRSGLRSSMGKKGMVMATSVLAVMTVIFGVIGAIFLGLRRYEVDHDDHSVCRYKRSPATACGIVAALLALMTQIVASVTIGCCGAWSIPKGANRTAAIVFYIISWVLVIITVLAFLGGALLGIEGYIEKTIETGSCVGAVGGVGVFVETTFLFLIVAAFEVATYLLSRKDDHRQAVAGDNPPHLGPAAASKDDAYPSAPEPANQV